jgi:aldehyde:ferredoxin oxidoreductase
MKNGYWQRMLRIDLANRKTRVEDIPEKDLRRFIDSGDVDSYSALLIFRSTHPYGLGYG